MLADRLTGELREVDVCVHATCRVHKHRHAARVYS
jgi:hypothetical protein